MASTTRIRSVSVKVKLEEHPDLSHLGEFKRQWEPGAIPSGLDRDYKQWFVPCNSGENARQWYRKHGWPKHTAWLKGQQQERGDLARAIGYGDQWYMVGILAEAEVLVPHGPPGHSIIQTLRSGGLWGIETDSESSYFVEVAKEELAALVEVLNEMGFEGDAFEGFDLDELAQDAGDKESVAQEVQGGG